MVTGETGGVGTTPVIVVGVVVDGVVVGGLVVVGGDVVEDDEILVVVVVGGLVVVVEGLGATVVVVVGPVAPEASRVGRVRPQTVAAAAMPTTPRRVNLITRRERELARSGSVWSPPPQDRLIRIAPLSRLRSLTPSRLTVPRSTFAVGERGGRVVTV
ncbi:MAG: hypothetical protein ABSG39_06210 [Acidimicrobiales bacterium]